MVELVLSMQAVRESWIAKMQACLRLLHQRNLRCSLACPPASLA